MPDPTPTQPADSGSDPLLEQLILAHEDGQMLQVERILANHPDRAEGLRQRLEELRELGILSPPRQPVMPERLGDFRLLRPLGRGGMGLVYLAVQESLQREVALKLVRPEQLYFPDAKERFRREVLAVARLQHPGIVPVYTFGEVEGVPFYAMARLEGVTLGELLQVLADTQPEALDGPSLARAFQSAMQQKGESVAEPRAPLFTNAWTRACCQLVRDMAEALQHAHEQGVLHRDLKPSNAILTADGTVHLIDFGLASAQGEQRLTRSGATMGSLPYMAPEQVRGEVQAIDARTDVYALGVTLYELLTLRLPHGDGSGSTRESILLGTVTAPTRLNPKVHGDAEAICLQAMEIDPARRYQSAAALAADLQRFLDQEPVLARRQTAALRARRWLRRHPARATAAALAFVLVVIAPLLFALQQNAAAARLQLALEEVQAQQRIAEQNLDEARQQSRRADANLDRALEAVDLMLSRTAEARLAGIPRSATLRKQLLQDALHFHEALAATETGARTIEERARSRRRVGQIELDLGEVHQGIAALQQARDELLQLLPQAQDPLRLHTELAEISTALAGGFSHLGRRSERHQAVEQSIEHWQYAVDAEPQRRSYQLALGDAKLGRVNQLLLTDRITEATAMLDQIERELDPKNAPELRGTELARWLHEYAHLADVRGVMLTHVGDTQNAERAFGLALQRHQLALAAAPDDLGGRGALAGLQARLALLAMQRRDWTKARPLIQAAIDSLQKLADDFPEMPEWQARLATMLGSRADNASKLGDDQGAAADHDRAVAMLQAVTRRYPDEVDYHRQLATAYGERAMAEAKQGRFEPANADAEAGIAGFRSLLQAHPDDEQSAANLVAALGNLAHLQADMGDVTTARRTVAEATAMSRTRKFGEAERAHIELLMAAADLAMRDMDEAEGIALMQQGKAAAEQWLQRQPDDVLRLATLAMLELNLGITYVQIGDLDKAQQVFTAALPVARGAAPKSQMGHRVLGTLLLRLADLQLRQGRKDEGRKWFAAAITETGVTKAKADTMPPLGDLFLVPEFQDLLPATGPQK